MIWFRMALVFGMGGVLVFCLGEVTGILVMMTNGLAAQSMELDPARNGTLPTYVFILMFLFCLMACCIYGFILCILIWKNKFQMDHQLRHYFIIWVGCWVFSIFANMGISIYALVRNKDPQGQMGFMYEMFQKGAHESKFISSFEKLQRENSCCGIYGPDDWLMIQLRSNPGGMGSMQSFDYGFQQNPSSGKCHLIPPTIPPGCGQKIMTIVNSVLNMYAALSMVLVVVGVAVGIIAWYCFFYWLEKEVIVIPEDEVSNIIIVEPEPSDTGSQYLRSTGYLGGGYDMRNSVANLPPGSYIRHGESIYPVSRANMPFRSSRRTTVITRPSRYNPEASRYSRYNGEGPGVSRYSRFGDPNPYLGGGSRHHNQTQILHSGYLNHSGYLHPGQSRLSRRGEHEEHHHETVLEKQEHMLGGKLVAEMHVDHNMDKNSEKNAQHAQGSSKHQAHHATIAIVRNQHKNDPQPKPMANHGHTGHLAEDIAEMSGRNALPKLDDVYIPVDGVGHHPQLHHSATPVVSLGSVTGNRAQNTLEDELFPQHLKKEKKARDHDRIEEEHNLIHPHYLPGTTPPGTSRQAGMHGRGGFSQIGPHPTQYHLNHDHHYLGGSGVHHENHGPTHSQYPGRSNVHNSMLHNNGLGSGIGHHHTAAFLGPPHYGPGHPSYVHPAHSHRPSTAAHHDEHHHPNEEHHHHPNEEHHHEIHHPSHGSRQIHHIDPGHGSLVRREDRSRSRTRARSENTKILFKNPNVLEDSD